MTAEPVFGISLPWFPPQVDVRVDPGALSGRVGVPPEPNSVAGEDPEVLWLGPDEWLFVGTSAAGPGGGAMCRQLDRALEGIHHSAVDVTANRAVFDLFGTDRMKVLSKGCGLDLHPRSWYAGRCAQTLLARVPVILHERAATTRVFVRPSFVPYLDRWFAAAGPR